jgi:hypothetical protein
MTVTEKCEIAAVRLTGIVSLVKATGFLFLVVGVFSILLDFKKVGFYSIVVSFWFLGLYFFYEIYNPLKKENGVAIPLSSRVGSSSSLDKAFVFVFVAVWFSVLLFITVSFLQSVHG